jgi:hypothetical protein
VLFRFRETCIGIVLMTGDGHFRSPPS